MHKILFICHGNILKSIGKACKINDFTMKKGTYYTTTTPFVSELEPWFSKGKRERDEICIIVEFWGIFCYDMNWVDSFYPI